MSKYTENLTMIYIYFKKICRHIRNKNTFTKMLIKIYYIL